jgi:hypothetical protein
MQTRKVLEQPLFPPSMRAHRDVRIATVRQYGARRLGVYDDNRVTTHRSHLSNDYIKVRFFDVLQDINVDEEIGWVRRLPREGRNRWVVPNKLGRIAKVQLIQQF